MNHNDNVRVMLLGRQIPASIDIDEHNKVNRGARQTEEKVTKLLEHSAHSQTRLHSFGAAL
jgi:hypothetical protein